MADIKIDISVNQRNAQQRIDNLRKSVNRTGKEFTNLNKGITASGVALGSFVGNIAAAGFGRVVSGIKSLASAAIGTVGELETLSTQFEVLTGSAAEAANIVKDLQEFAASTPFQFKDLAKATQRLLSFGFTAEEAKENLVDLGDVSAASGADISELSLIFGQVAAAGKLTGERLLQFQERAIPIGPALAETLGVAESAVKDLVSNGKVDFDTFERAFKSLNEEGSFAFEGLTKRSRTLEGRISTLGDNLELVTAKLGSQFGPAVKAITTATTTFIQTLSNTKAFEKFGQSVGDFVPAAIRIGIDAFQLLSNVVLNSLKAFDLFRSGISTALSGIVSIISDFLGTVSNVASALGLQDTAFQKAAEAAKNFTSDVSDALGSTADTFAESAASIDASQKEVNLAIEAGRQSFEDELQTITEASNAETETVVGNNTKKVESIKALTAEEIKAAEDKLKREQELQEKLRSAKEQVAIAEETQRLFGQEQEQIFTDERLIRLEESFSREEEARIQAGINAATNETEKQILINQAIETGLNEQTKLRQKAADDEVRIQKLKQQFALQGASGTFGALADIARLGGKKNFEIAKAFSLAEASIRGVLSVQQAIATPPGPPFTIPLGIAAGAQAAARVATIASTKPSFETGGIVPGNSFTGDNVAANVNSGEMVLTRQQQSNLFNMANRGGGSGGQPMNITVQSVLDGEVVSESVSRWVANGGQLGEVQ